MKTYLVTYRIDEPVDGVYRDLAPFYVAIQRLSAFANPMESVWIACTTLSAQQLHKRLAPFFDEKDRLLVVECGETAAWHGIPEDTSVWLENEFGSLRHLVPRRWTA
jgi:hypothetical protein